MGRFFAGVGLRTFHSMVTGTHKYTVFAIHGLFLCGRGAGDLIPADLRAVTKFMRTFTW